jgi:1-phosphofructokinase family hexose kinase
MRFNPLGPKLSRAEWCKLTQQVERELQRAHLLILSGSLPRGVPVPAYAQLTRLAHLHGLRTVLDCDGPAFAAAVTARPFLVKPNEHELASWWGEPLTSEAEILRAARTLSRQTCGWVLVSRGAKRALLVNQAGGFHFTAMPPCGRPRNTVGAGDALLAAVVGQIQTGAPPETWLRAGLAAGSAATQCAAGDLARS